MILYGLKACDTCRKAMKALADAGLSVRLADVREDGVPSDILERAQAQFGDALVNTRSTTWRGLSETDREEPPLDLLARHPALMKRPLIEREGSLFLGWTKPTQDALLNGS
ncbi:MAG: ArsC/Spx/MgsR family protein [Pseudomonadota bacterium]